MNEATTWTEERFSAPGGSPPFSSELASGIQGGRLYEALQLPSSSTDVELIARVEDEIRSLESAARASDAPMDRDLASALRNLHRIRALICRPEWRTEYDFRYGYVHAAARIDAAVAGTGSSLDELRRIWARVFPDRLVRARALMERGGPSNLYAASRLDPFHPRLACLVVDDAMRGGPPSPWSPSPEEMAETVRRRVSWEGDHARWDDVSADRLDRSDVWPPRPDGALPSCDAPPTDALPPAGNLPPEVELPPDCALNLDNDPTDPELDPARAFAPATDEDARVVVGEAVTASAPLSPPERLESPLEARLESIVASSSSAAIAARSAETEVKRVADQLAALQASWQRASAVATTRAKTTPVWLLPALVVGAALFGAALLHVVTHG